MSKIMSFTATALKNLFSEPATTKYPAVPKEYPERTRGHVENDIEQCILCGMCMRKCPSNAIKVDRAQGTWSIERFDCIQCGYCAECCPKKCLKMVPGYQEPEEEKQDEVVKKPNIPKPPVKNEINSSEPNETVINKNRDNPTTDPQNVAATLEKQVPSNDTESCVYCTLCAKKCPAEAISVDRETKSWSVDPEKCLSCGVCAESCPKHCINLN